MSKPTVKAQRKAAKVTWSAGVSPDADITGYRVRVYTRAAGGKPVKSVTVSGDTRSRTVTKLKARKKYWVTITPIVAGYTVAESPRTKVKTK